MAEAGWDAKGLIKPLWGRVGGRDALAALAGITPPQTLSAYNSGSRPLGIVNARKIAAALDISVLELGAPAELADPPGREILARLEAAEAAVTELAKKHRRDVTSLARRVLALERQARPGTPPAKENPG